MFCKYLFVISFFSKERRKRKNKVKNEEIMDNRNRLRDVTRSPYNKHSKAPLMRIIDIFNQPNW